MTDATTTRRRTPRRRNALGRRDGASRGPSSMRHGRDDGIRTTDTHLTQCTTTDATTDVTTDVCDDGMYADDATTTMLP
jgi:hypothetical protein